MSNIDPDFRKPHIKFEFRSRALGRSVEHPIVGFFKRLFGPKDQLCIRVKEKDLGDRLLGTGITQSDLKHLCKGTKEGYAQNAALKRQLHEHLSKLSNINLYTDFKTPDREALLYKALLNRIDPNDLLNLLNTDPKNNLAKELNALSPKTLIKALKNRYTEHAFTQLRNAEGPNGLLLNLDNVLHDPSIREWKTLRTREKAISEREWQDLQATLMNACNNLLIHKRTDDDTVRDLTSILSWFGKTMQTKDAAAGQQVIRKRVANIVDFIKAQSVALNNLTDPNALQAARQIGLNLVEILKEGSTGCPDRAAFHLAKAELYIQAFANRTAENPFGNTIPVLVNEFKRNLIATELTNPNYRESLESCFYHSILLDEALGLEYENKSMKWAICAQPIPKGVALDKVYKKITTPDLVGFIGSHPLFLSCLSEDKNAIMEKQLDFLDELGALKDSRDFTFDAWIEVIRARAQAAETIEDVHVLHKTIEAFLGDFTNKDLSTLMIEYNTLKRREQELKETIARNLLVESGFLGNTLAYKVDNALE